MMAALRALQVWRLATGIRLVLFIQRLCNMQMEPDFSKEDGNCGDCGVPLPLNRAEWYYCKDCSHGIKAVPVRTTMYGHLRRIQREREVEQAANAQLRADIEALEGDEDDEDE